MPVDMFIKIGDLEGESTDDKHRDEVDVLAWSWGMSQSGTFHGGGGGGAGKVSVQDISFTKYVDKCTPNLMMACSLGTHIDVATLVVRKAGGDKPVEYLKVEMKGVMVTSINVGGSAASEDRLTENVSLNFAKVFYQYTLQDYKGAAGPKIDYKFDVQANKKG